MFKNIVEWFLMTGGKKKEKLPENSLLYNFLLSLSSYEAYEIRSDA